MEAQGSGRLPSQTITNPNENVSTIALRGGKQLEELHKKLTSDKDEENEKRDLLGIFDEANLQIEVGKPPKKIPRTEEQPVVPALPFPSQFSKSKKEKSEKKILETFRKVQVNIPLPNAIKQLPRYAKFLKELSTNKHKLRGDEKVKVGENVFAVIQRKLPQKRKDSETFTIPCIIGRTQFEKAILVFGVSINMMPYSIYSSLNLGPLEETRVVIQLVDRSNIYPRGVVEDVSVFPDDFYIIEMEDEASYNPTLILLGRPLLKTT